MSFKNKLDSLLPPYTRIPLASVLCMNLLAYFATKPIAQGFVHYDFTLAIDGAIPLVPAFSLIYVLAYVQWVAGFILIARESRGMCYRVLSGEMISKLICMVFFLLLPTTMVRPEITSDGFFSGIVKIIYMIDTPVNLFPSIHCLESWLCFRGAMQIKKAGGWYRYFSLAFTLLVFASTVLIKQHCVVDIIGGVLVCEAGQLIAKRTNSAAIFEKLEAHHGRDKKRDI